jgi:hypothetical protein
MSLQLLQAIIAAHAATVVVFGTLPSFMMLERPELLSYDAVDDQLRQPQPRQLHMTCMCIVASLWAELQRSCGSVH